MPKSSQNSDSSAEKSKRSDGVGAAQKNGNAPVTAAEASPAAKPSPAPPAAAVERKSAKPGKSTIKATPHKDSEDMLARMDKLEQAVTKLVETQTSLFAHGAATKAHGANFDPGSVASTSKYAMGECSTATSLEDAIELHSEDNDQVMFSDSDDDGGLSSPYAPPVMDKGKKIPVMAARFASPSGVGDPIDEDIAETINFMMGQKLDEKALKETNDKYACPANTEFALIVPKVNPEIWEMTSSVVKTRDLRLQTLQKSLVKGISAFAQNLSSDNMTEAQQDGLALLCDASFQLSAIRREGIKPDLGQFGRKLCKRPVNSSKFLFGDDLGQTLKELREEKKAMEGMMKPPRSHSSQHHPYKRTGDTRQKQSTPKNTGWTSQDFSGGSKQAGGFGKPFLGQWKGHHKEGPRSSDPSSARMDDQRTKAKGQLQRHGQGRK